MNVSCIFQSALVMSSLTLFGACLGEDASRGPATNTGADTHTVVTMGAGAQLHDVTVADGRIRLTISPSQADGPHGSATVSDSLVIDLETVAAWRGDTSLDVAVVGSDLSSPDVVTTLRTDFVETVQNSPGGVEQSWRFERAPGKAGDLVLAVGATDLDYLGSDDRGLYLRRAGELEVSYSHGTWIDAGGHAWAIPARFDGGRIVLTVPAAAVASSTFPAVLDPKIVVTPIAS